MMRYTEHTGNRDNSAIWRLRYLRSENRVKANLECGLQQFKVYKIGYLLQSAKNSNQIRTYREIGHWTIWKNSNMLLQA